MTVYEIYNYNYNAVQIYLFFRGPKYWGSMDSWIYLGFKLLNLKIANLMEFGYLGLTLNTLIWETYNFINIMCSEERFFVTNSGLKGERNYEIKRN